MQRTSTPPTQRPYRAMCVPHGTPPDQVEALARNGALRTVAIKARDADAAGKAAHQQTGMAVHSVERDAEAVA